MKRKMRTALSFALIMALAIPTLGLPSGISAEASRDFEESFTEYDTPVNIKEQTGGRWTTYWSNQESDTKSIEDSGLGDGSGNVLRMHGAGKANPCGSVEG